MFVWAMLAMAALGITLALVRSKAPALNVPAGLTTIYLVATALTVVREPSPATATQPAASNKPATTPTPGALAPLSGKVVLPNLAEEAPRK